MAKPHIHRSGFHGLALALSAWVLALAAGCMDFGQPQQLTAGREADSDSDAASRLLSPLIERTVSEGDTVTLRTGVPAEDLETATSVWVQTSGPSVELGDVSAPTATFIAPQVDENSILVFQFLLIMDGGSALQQTVVHVQDVGGKGIQPPCGAAGFLSGTGCNAATGICETVDPCEGIVCDAGRICDDESGACVQAEACGDVVCASDERCNPDRAQCEPACPDVVCMADERLNIDACECEPEDLCAEASCDEGEACDPLTGACIAVDLCEGVSCPEGAACDAATGECLADDPCSAPASGDVFTVVDTAIGSTQFTLVPEFWLEFDTAVDPATFDPGDVEVMHAGPDNQWGTSDDATLTPTAQHDGSRRITVSLAPKTGALLGGRHYRVTLSPGCLRATGSGGAELGLDGEFDGTFPSGDGQVGGAFVQEFLGAAPGTYAGQSLCHEETRDILGRVTREDVHYDDSVVVTGDGDLLYAGRPIRPGETMMPEGFDITMTVQSVSLDGDSWYTVYDVVGTKDGYAFDGLQDESYTFNDDGTITHTGTSAFTVRSNRGVVVAEFDRTCEATLRP